MPKKLQGIYLDIKSIYNEKSVSFGQKFQPKRQTKDAEQALVMKQPTTFVFYFCF